MKDRTKKQGAAEEIVSDSEPREPGTGVYRRTQQPATTDAQGYTTPHPQHNYDPETGQPLMGTPQHPAAHRTAHQLADQSAATGRIDLLSGEKARQMADEWRIIQAGFVDDPRTSVARADQLVGRATDWVADSFARERERLEQRWERGGEVSTEELRQLLQQYRAFFQKLMSLSE